MNRFLKRALLGAGAVIAVPVVAFAVVEFQASGGPVGAFMMMWLNGSTAVPTSTANPIPAAIVGGSSIIGKVGIDQTTPGTTNGVQVNAPLPAGSNAIGSVNVSNLPATQPVSGTVALGAGSASVGTVGVTALPALPAGTNAIGSVQSGPLPYTAQPLTTSVITTTGVSVVVLGPGTHNKGGWLRNCNAANTMFFNDQAPASLTEGGSNAAQAPGLGGSAPIYGVPPGNGTIYAAGQAGAQICGEGQN